MALSDTVYVYIFNYKMTVKKKILLNILKKLPSLKICFFDSVFSSILLNKDITSRINESFNCELALRETIAFSRFVFFEGISFEANLCSSK
jgi:hypothetical protein